MVKNDVVWLLAMFVLADILMLVDKNAEDQRIVIVFKAFV